MDIQAKNRLTMLRQPVTARREASSPGLYSWVWVIPLPGGHYRVRAFEVARHLIDEHIEFYDGDIRVVHDEIVHDLDKVDAAVLRTNVYVGSLEAPWKNDFPL